MSYYACVEVVGGAAITAKQQKIVARFLTSMENHRRLQLCVSGATPPPRMKQRKVTNSERTTTTANLSQHKYLVHRRRAREMTRMALEGPHDNYCRYWNPDSIASSEIDGQSQTTTESKPTISSHIISDSASFRINAIEPTSGNSVTVRYSELKNLVKAVQLWPRSGDRGKLRITGKVNQTKDERSSREDIDDEMETERCGPTGPASLFSDSFISAISIPVPHVQHSGKTSHSIPIPHRRVLSACGHGTTLSSKPPASRRKTKSVPSKFTDSSKMSRNETPELKLSTPWNTGRTKAMFPSSLTGVDFETLKNKRKRLLQLRQQMVPHPPEPKHHWYEMRTPEFHVEARRNNTMLRSCNW